MLLANPTAIGSLNSDYIMKTLISKIYIKRSNDIKQSRSINIKNGKTVNCIFLCEIRYSIIRAIKMNKLNGVVNLHVALAGYYKKLEIKMKVTFTCIIVFK